MKTIKSELQSEVQATLGAMHAKYEEEKKIDEEVNKAAKELEWAKDLYGQYRYMKLTAFQEVKDAPSKTGQ